MEHCAVLSWRYTRGRRIGAEVDVLDDGECMFSKTSAGGKLKVGQVLRLDFEEGPCKNVTYLDGDLAAGSGDPAEPVDASLPGHKLRCTPHTYAGNVSSVAVGPWQKLL
jgi:hypothetical protein